MHLDCGLRAQRRWQHLDRHAFFFLVMLLSGRAALLMGLRRDSPWRGMA